MLDLKACHEFTPADVEWIQIETFDVPCQIRVGLHDGRTLVKESREYPRFSSQPMSWQMACNKFDRLAAPFAAEAKRKAITTAVGDLENVRVRDLMELMASVEMPLRAENRKHG